MRDSARHEKCTGVQTSKMHPRDKDRPGRDRPDDILTAASGLRVADGVGPLPLSLARMSRGDPGRENLAQPVLLTAFCRDVQVAEHVAVGWCKRAG